MPWVHLRSTYRNHTRRRLPIRVGTKTGRQANQLCQCEPADGVVEGVCGSMAALKRRGAESLLYAPSVMRRRRFCHRGAGRYSCVDRHCWNSRNSSSRSSAVNLWWRAAPCLGKTTLSARWSAASWLGVGRCVHELAWAKAAITQMMRFS